ncbi:ABC transporter substrate-binding protein [Halobellus sp. MBLA0160]|uniref:ABC transporter substrate-binding protein n=2 Tax=Halobellus ruber TaxID=2761102 RepID=A0A7J9SET8_9EURY|nr:ABC transporter substrate-binding protein [Halobellus ruber]
MKESGLASLAAAGIGATAGCLGGGGGSGPPTAEIGYIPITDASPLLAGYANDHFADHDVDVAEPTLFRGWADLAEAFLAGEVNVAHFLMPMTVWMRYGDQLSGDVNVVAWDHTDGSALTVRQEIDEWADLGGTTVAVPFWYSIHNVILQLGLREKGLTPRTDSSAGAVADDEVNLVVMPPPDMPAALANGSITGYIVAEPFNAIGELEAGGKILRFTGDIWRRHACCVVVMKEELVESQPEWTTDVMRGLVDAQQYIRENRSEAARLLSDAESGLLPQGPEPIDRALTHYANHDPYLESGAIQHEEWDVERIGFYPYPYQSYTEELVRRMRETRVEGEDAFLEDLDPSTVADDLVAYDPVRTALKDAGGPPAFDVSEDNGYERQETIRF